MSDREIFYAGLFASVLMALHLAINIYQFWKMGRDANRKLEETGKRES
jgi:hypothetical protein